MKAFKNPTVSVVVPTYNRAHLIGKTIQSILQQTYQDFEIIVVDDASIDNTKEIIKNFKNKNIIYIRHKNNRGAQAARNTGIKIARGKWIAFLDSDDEWLPQKIEEELFLACKTGASVIYSECYIRSSTDNKLKVFGIHKKSGNIYKDLLKHPGPMFQGLLVRKECLECIGYLDENIVSYQEWDTAIRLARYYEFEFIEKPLFIYNRYQIETISKDIKKDANGWAQIVEKHRKDITKIAGENALQHHYIILAMKYYTAREFKISSTYYIKLSVLSFGFLKIKYALQSLLAKNHINPVILDLNRVFRYIIFKIYKSCCPLIMFKDKI